MRIIGIDPGLHITGYGVIEAYERGKIQLLDAGVIKTSTKKEMSQRLFTIHTEFSRIIEEFNPEICVLEELYSHYKHPMTSILMGHARGVICTGCGIHQIQLISAPAKRIKKAITGNGNATKDQVNRMVCSILQLASTPRYNDVTDALALAIGFVQIMKK